VASDVEKRAILNATFERGASQKLPPESIQSHLDSLCKPPGSLGYLESLAFELCRIQGSLTPVARPRRVVVFAADHGVASRGVTAWPSDVTAAVVGVMVTGRSASGVLARSSSTDFRVVNVGCLYLPPVQSDVNRSGSCCYISDPVSAGTADLSVGPAMTRTQFNAAWRVGAAQADAAADDGMKVVAAGEMGIGNTTSAACLVTLLTEMTPYESVGRGAGVSDEGLVIKREIVQRATDRAKHWVDRSDWKGVACEVGGFEIVAMAAFFVRSSQRRLTIVVDGFIATAAALLAEKLNPGTASLMIASHLSSESGHMKSLEALRLTPFLGWSLRLGEATGALLLMPMLDAAAAIVNEMAKIEDVSP